MSFPALLRHSKYLLGDVTWRDVEAHFGIDERLRRRITNEPGYVFSAETALQIEQSYKDLLKEKERIPLPENIWVWREDLIELKKRPGSEALRRHLLQIETFLQWANPTAKLDQLLACYVSQLHFLTKGLQGGTAGKWWSRRDSLKKAELEGERGMKLLNEVAALKLSPVGRRAVAWLRPVIFLNWVQAIVERQKLGHARSQDDVIGLLREQKVLEVVDQALEDNHYFWQLAYNGVELASWLTNKHFAKKFYGHLTALDPGFASFDYTPGEVLAFNAEPGMAWFCNTFAHLHKPIVRKDPKIEIEGGEK